MCKPPFRLDYIIAVRSQQTIVNRIKLLIVCGFTVENLHTHADASLLFVNVIRKLTFFGFIDTLGNVSLSYSV